MHIKSAALRIYALAALLAVPAIPATATSWPVFGFVPARTGFNTAETTLTKLNVGRLRAHWHISLGAVADSTPILLDRVVVDGVVFVAMGDALLAPYRDEAAI